LKSLQKTLPVATNCGSCACFAKEIIEETLEAVKSSAQHQVA
jgi:bacterioferritin-associated ferredoxin